VRNILAITGGVVADAIRRKVLYLVFVLSVVLAAAIPQLPTYGAGVILNVYKEIALAIIFVLSLALTLSLSANRVPAEIERRTVYNVLSKRVRRWEYLVGTWLGILAVMAIAIGAFTLVTQGIGLVRYHDPIWRIWEGTFGIWLEMGAIAAFAIAVSSLVGPVVVVTSSLAFLFFAHSRGTMLGDSPKGILAILYPSFDTFNVINPVAHGDGITLAYALSMVVVFVAWSALLLLAGSAAFGRRDL
jgi:ABC-type transport system involved in multi-copper enzyme maturation permease subunit